MLLLPAIKLASTATSVLPPASNRSTNPSIVDDVVITTSPIALNKVSVPFSPDLPSLTARPSTLNTSSLLTTPDARALPDAPASPVAPVALAALVAPVYHV